MHKSGYSLARMSAFPASRMDIDPAALSVRLWNGLLPECRQIKLMTNSAQILSKNSPIW